MQLNLFDNPPKPKLARRSDPETSQDAAAETAPKLTRIQQALLQAASDMGGTQTANELAEWVQASSSVEANTETIRKRVGELKRFGELIQCKARPCRVTGKAAATFRRPFEYLNAEPAP